MKILNLYAGIGGNRKLWTPKGDEHEITAIELDPKIATIYQDFFPNDTVLIGDAHKYLLDHHKEFDFIWSSPPCQSHSQIRKNLGVDLGKTKTIYPDLKLYEEVLLLKNFCEVKWCVENTISYYKPLIEPQEINKHYFWTNFYIRPMLKGVRNHSRNVEILQKTKGFDLSKYSGIDKRQVLRNCVEPETGLHIFNEAFKNSQQSLI